MHCAPATILLAAACSSEQELSRDIEVDAVPSWGDSTKASTVSRNFVAAFPDVHGGLGRVLLVRSEIDTSVTVEQRTTPSGWAAQRSETFDISAGALTWLHLDEMDWLHPEPSVPYTYDPEDPWQHRGSAVVVRSDVEVEVLALWNPVLGEDTYGGYNDRAIARLLPIEELGSTYQVVVPGPTNPAKWERYFVVVAVANDTEVVAAPLAEPVVLDVGEIARVAVSSGDAIGDQSFAVTADKPVAVFTGADSLWCQVGETWEQLPPVSRWGTDYVAIPIDAHDSSDLVVVAHQGTVVQLDCGDPVAMLPGDVLRVELQQPTRVTATRPIMALVESRGRDCPDWAEGPGMAALTPQALSRVSTVVEPLELELATPGFVYETMFDAKMTTIAAVAGGSPVVTTDPPLDPVAVVPVGGTFLELLHVSEPTALSGSHFVGLQYHVVPYREDVEGGTPTDDAYDAYDWWLNATSVTHLGYDCVACVAGLSMPADCR